jgi:hypothetical protein
MVIFHSFLYVYQWLINPQYTLLLRGSTSGEWSNPHFLSEKSRHPRADKDACIKQEQAQGEYNLNTTNMDVSARVV